MFSKSYLEIAQWATSKTVAIGTASALHGAAVTYTEVDEDSKILDLGCAVGGLLVAKKVEPQTDAAVEWVANKLSKIKIRRNKIATEES